MDALFQARSGGGSTGATASFPVEPTVPAQRWSGMPEDFANLMQSALTGDRGDRFGPPNVPRIGAAPDLWKGVVNQDKAPPDILGADATPHPPDPVIAPSSQVSVAIASPGAGDASKSPAPLLFRLASDSAPPDTNEPDSLSQPEVSEEPFDQPPFRLSAPGVAPPVPIATPAPAAGSAPVVAGRPVADNLLVAPVARPVYRMAEPTPGQANPAADETPVGWRIDHRRDRAAAPANDLVPAGRPALVSPDLPKEIASIAQHVKQPRSGGVTLWETAPQTGEAPRPPEQLAPKGAKVPPVSLARNAQALAVDRGAQDIPQLQPRLPVVTTTASPAPATQPVPVSVLTETPLTPAPVSATSMPMRPPLADLPPVGPDADRQAAPAPLISTPKAEFTHAAAWATTVDASSTLPTARAGMEPDLSTLVQIVEGPDPVITLSNTASPSVANTPAVLLSASPTPQAAIAQQVVAALREARGDTGGQIELALDPPELGRLRLSVSDAPGGLTLLIHADRPETADLMRRHLSLLAEEFARAGLDAPSVEIGTGDGRRSGRQPAPPPDARPDASTPGAVSVTDSVPPRAMRSADGMDIRL